MKTVEKGHYVKLHYTGRLENGEIFDSSEGKTPFEFRVGANQVIPGFEKAIIGMKINEKKTFTVEPEEAYGERDERLKQSFLRSELPMNFQPSVGEILALQTEDGTRLHAIVTEVTPHQITIDLNHPLAGQRLTFEVEILEINDAPSPTFCGSGGCSCC